MNFASLDKTYIIAEIGVNHGGNVDMAKQMVGAAKAAGADAVKFQTFVAERLVTPGTAKVKYQELTTAQDEDHFTMIKNLEFRWEDHIPVFEECRKHGIDFISTPYDIESAKFLNEIGVSLFKVASADIVDLPLHEYLASTHKPVILATGMASLGEVEFAVDIYREAQSLNICLLHCVSNYPCSNSSLNLRTMYTLASAFQLPVGFSDHSIDDFAAGLAIALGARIVEKHFTLDKAMPGPDHRASSTPSEFSALVNTIRRAEAALGSARKQCQPEERQMALISRKSIVASREISAGHRLDAADITTKRPGTGLPPAFIRHILGRAAKRNIPVNTIITLDDLA